jgi:hypothetical protein
MLSINTVYTSSEMKLALLTESLQTTLLASRILTPYAALTLALYGMLLLCCLYSVIRRRARLARIPSVP